jgi:DNA repair exonuclease SbcCD ATPase subunit
MTYFLVIRWKNLLSTGNAWTEVRLDKYPMTLIIGKNGAGKSTLLDALTFVLFGKPFRNINKPKLINSINDSNLVVEVEFRSGSRHYKIVRGQKPDIFEIHQDNILINQDASSKDYQKHLEKTILGFNMKSFTQIVIVGSSSFIPFMRLKTDERRMIIEDLLDIEIFSTMNKVLKIKTRNVSDSSNEIKNKISGIMEKIELQKKFINESKKSNEEQIEKKRNEVSNNQIQITNLSNDANLIQKHIHALEAKILDEVSVRDNIQKLEKYRIKIDTNINNLSKEIDFYNNNSNCPKCKQDINNRNKMVSICQHKLENSKEGIKQLEEKQSELEQRLDNIKGVHTKVSEHQMELTRILSTISEIQKHNNKLLNDINELSSKKPISDDLLQVSKNLYSDLEKLNNDRKDIIDKRAYYDMATLLLKDKGIKAKIIKQYLPVINKMVNKYLTSMDFFVNFNIDEEFKETIKSRHRDLFSYENFSEGEKLRIDLALLFTWRAVAKIKNSMNTNLLILDEIFDGSLDASGTEEFMRLLHTFGNEANIFLISHKSDILIDKFTNILKFDKIGSFSEAIRLEK